MRILLQDLLRSSDSSDLPFNLKFLFDVCDSRIEPLEAHSLQAKLSVFIDFTLLAFV